MKILPYKIEEPKLIQGEKVLNLSQKIFQQRLKRYSKQIKEKCGQQFPEGADTTFRMASPSQSPQQQTEQEYQVLVGILIAKYPNRKTAAKKFETLLEVEFQGAEVLDLSGAIYYLKCEHVVVELKDFQFKMQPGVVLGVRGVKTIDEKFQVLELVKPFDFQFQKSGFSLQNKKENSLLIQNKLIDIQFEALMNYQFQNVEMLLSAPIEEPVEKDFEFSPTGTFLKTLYDFKKLDQMCSQLQNQVNLTLMTNLQSCVNKSLPQQEIPLQILEFTSVAGVNSVGNPIKIQWHNQIIQVFDGWFCQYYDEEQVVEDILSSGLLMSQVGGLIDIWNMNEEFNILDCDLVVILSEKEESALYEGNQNGKPIKIAFVGKYKGVFIDEQGKLAEWI